MLNMLVMFGDFADHCSEDDALHQQIITRNEMCVYYDQSEVNKVSREYFHSTSPKLRKLDTHTQLSAKKIMLTFLWDKRGVILKYYMRNSNWCCICRSPQKLPLSFNQIKMLWVSEYWYFVATWQGWPPYCQCHCCSYPRSIFWVSSQSAVFTRLCPKWFWCLRTIQRASA